ncbi:MULTISPECIES: SprT family zinc-dependent metalloprotease [unclassified Pseudoalteromonas]|uniref:M48 family metallopeptidase n=1 Tax=unclassified Pseudoalteromonas TaxID=194690 RepID=UPI002096F297|nr:SprT family zinc-dependent metalloprotease [Pseudoalteromonas sp. XMcav2-N]MCO7188349.1 M48 family metallopeptidase [Pseudoalteromonas sp. XMcav2-N]
MSFDYQLSISKRRQSVAIKVTADGVKVFAPYGIDKRWLDTWLKSKSHWVESKKLAMSAQQQQIQIPFDSKKIQIFGEQYQFELSPSCSYIDHDAKCIGLKTRANPDSEGARKALFGYLNQVLLSYVTPVLAEYSDLMRSEYQELKIREYKRRWGSLSSSGTLALNSLLVGAPKWVIDYVIVHELAHFHVMAHNQAFWKIVARHYPDYKKAQSYLSQNAVVLQIKE